MLKALEGKFFWEPSSSPSDQPSPDELQIRRLQKSFDKKRKVMRSAEAVEVDVEKRAKSAKMAVENYRKIIGKSFDAIDCLKTAIAHCYGVDQSLILKKATRKELRVPKMHFQWALLRYFPALSISELGRQIGKHHTVIMHGRDCFEKIKANHLDEIEIIDKAMEGFTCGC